MRDTAPAFKYKSKLDIDDQLGAELEELRLEWYRMYPKYGLSWKRMTIPELIKRLRRELDELIRAYRNTGPRIFVRDEAIDCALVALMIAERASREIPVSEHSSLEGGKG